MLDFGLHEALPHQVKPELGIESLVADLGVHSVARVATFLRDRDQETGELGTDAALSIWPQYRDAFQFCVVGEVAHATGRDRFAFEYAEDMYGACLELIPLDGVGDALFSAENNAAHHHCFHLVFG